MDGPLSWIELDAAALAANAGVLRGLGGGQAKLAAVVKANAYGHGLAEVVRLAGAAGADLFAVHSLEEALAVRRADARAPVLVLGPVARDGLPEAAAAGFHLTASAPEYLAELDAAGRRAGRPLEVHLKLECGTNRQGLLPAALEGVLAALPAQPGVRLAGVSTHFANIEDTTDHAFARRQLEDFGALAARVQQAAGRPLLRHAACSAAALLFPETRFELLRTGIALYGFWPSRETFVSCRERGGAQVPVLRRVLSWKARLTEVKEVAAGAFVGYGCSYRTLRASRLAILPVGYSDGYRRALSNAAHVLVRGRRAPVRGRVCMNIAIVDVTDVPGAARGDEAALLGRQGEEEVTAEHLAGLCGTIHYEILAGLAPGLARVVV